MCVRDEVIRKETKHLLLLSIECSIRKKKKKNVRANWIPNYFNHEVINTFVQNLQHVIYSKILYTSEAASVIELSTFERTLVLWFENFENSYLHIERK